MPRCPKCEKSFPEGTEFFPKDGESLELKGADLAVAVTACGHASIRDTRPHDKPRPIKESTEKTEKSTEKSAGDVAVRSSDTGDSLIGQVIGGVYRVVEKIGVGGMGVVYRLEHTNLQKPFALKVLGQVSQDHPDAVERFRQEAVSASHIEDVYSFLSTGDRSPDAELALYAPVGPNRDAGAVSDANRARSPGAEDGSVPSGDGVGDAGINDESRGTPRHSLSVITHPGGARIFIDGEPAGVTPYQASRLSTDQEVEIKISKGGFHMVRRRVTLDQDINLVIPLRKRYPSSRSGGGGPTLPIKTVY